MHKKIAALFFMVLMGTTFIQRTINATQSTDNPVITISYNGVADNLIRMSEIPATFSISGAKFALEGKDGRWEDVLKKMNGDEVETVSFNGFNPNLPHTLSVVLQNREIVNGVRPRNGYHGEDFKYDVPRGSSQVFRFTPTTCPGKKYDESLTYSLYSVDGNVILPIGYAKLCKGPASPK